MVRGNRKAKKAARSIQSSTGNGYARSRRIAMNEFSVKCQQCNNPTRNPSGLCHHHEGKGGQEQQSVNVSATPPSSFSTPEPMDMESISEEMDEVEGFDNKVDVLHRYRHDIGGEDAEEIIVSQVPYHPSYPLSGSDGAFKALAQRSAGTPEVMDGGRTIQFTDEDGGLVASISDGDESTYMYKEDPDWLHGHTMEARDEAIRGVWPEWGQPQEGNNKTIDELLDSPTEGPHLRKAVSPVNDATWNSMDRYVERLAARNGLDADELRDRAWDSVKSTPSSAGKKGGGKRA